MDNSFIALFAGVARLKELVEQRDELQEQKNELSFDARQFKEKVIKAYKEKEDYITGLIDQAEAENENHKKEIVELTKRQVKEGAAFKDAARLKQLKSDVSTHELNLEALQQLRNEVVISAEDQKIISDYRTLGTAACKAITSNAYNIIEKLLEIKNLSGVNCPALFDFHIMKVREEVFYDIFAETDKMRKEILK